MAPAYAGYPVLGINITPISTIVEAPNCATPPLPTLPYITAARLKRNSISEGYPLGSSAIPGTSFLPRFFIIQNFVLTPSQHKEHRWPYSNFRKLWLLGIQLPVVELIIYFLYMGAEMMTSLVHPARKLVYCPVWPLYSCSILFLHFSEEIDGGRLIFHLFELGYFTTRISIGHRVTTHDAKLQHRAPGLQANKRHPDCGFPPWAWCSHHAVGIIC